MYFLYFWMCQQQWRGLQFSTFLWHKCVSTTMARTDNWLYFWRRRGVKDNGEALKMCEKSCLGEHRLTPELLGLLRRNGHFELSALIAWLQAAVNFQGLLRRNGHFENIASLLIKENKETAEERSARQRLNLLAGQQQWRQRIYCWRVLWYSWATTMAPLQLGWNSCIATVLCGGKFAAFVHMHQWVHLIQLVHRPSQQTHIKM